MILGPLLGIAVGRHAEHHIRALHKGAAAHVHHAVRDVHANEFVHHLEGRIINNLHRVGEDDLRQAAAAGKRILAHAHQLAALFEYDLRRVGLAIEGEGTQGGDVLTHHDLLHPVAVIVPGAAVVLGKVGHDAAAADGQRAAVGQAPAHAVTQHAALQNLIGILFTGLIRDVVIPGPLLGIAAGQHTHLCIGTILKDGWMDIVDVVRQVDHAELVAIPEGSGIDGGDTVGQYQALQPLHRLEGAVVDALQLAALFKGDRGAAGSHAEGICTDGGDTGTHMDALDPGLELEPGHRAKGFGLIHGPRSGQQESTVRIEDKLDVHTAQAGGQNARIGTLHKDALFKDADLAADDALALECVTVLLKEGRHRVDVDITDLILAGYKVHLASILAVSCPAGVHDLLCIANIAAFGAAELSGAPVIDQGMLIIFAAGLFLGVGIHHPGAAIRLHIIGRHAEAVIVRKHGQIHRIELLRRHSKVEVGIIRDGIALLARGTADEVDNTVLLIHRAVLQGLRTRIGMVVTGEHEVDARLVQYAGYQLVDLRIAAGDIGVVRGLMHAQHLPLSLALRCVFLQPAQRLSQLRLGAGIVDNGKVYISVGNRVVAAGAAGGQIVHRRSCLALAVAGVLMVAQHVQNIRAAELIRAQQAGHVLPVAQPGSVVHRVAGLDTQAVATLADLVCQRCDVGQILGLDIAQDKEVQRIRSAGCKGLLPGPGTLVSHAVLVALARRQADDGHAVDHDRLVAAAGKGTQLRVGRQCHPAVAANRSILQELLLTAGCTGEPADVLLTRAIPGHVVEDIEGQLNLACGIIAENLILEGNIAACILGIDLIGARCGAEPFRHQAALLVGSAQQAVVRQIHGHIGRRLTLAGLHADGSAPAHNNGLRRDDVVGRHGHGDLTGGEGARALIRQHIAAGLHGIAERIALPQLSRNPETHRCDQIAGLCARLQLRIDSHHAGEALILVAALIAVGKFHRVIREELVQLQGGRNAADLAAADLQCDLLAQNRRLRIGCYRHRHSRIVSGIHGEVNGLGGLVAGLVAHRRGQGVRTVGQVHVAEVGLLAGGNALEVIGLVVIGIDAVDVHTNRVQPAGVAVVYIVLLRLKVQHAAGQHRAIGQRLLVHGDAADDRVVHVIHIGAVHKLHIVEVETARLLGTHHFGTVNIHQAEGHTGLDGEWPGISGQVCLQIAPTFPPHAGILIGPGALVRTECLGLEGEVIRLIAAVAVGHIASEPQAGGGTVTFPLDANTLRGIDPHADGRGHTGDRDLVAGTHAGTFRHIGAGTEVEVQLQGMAAEAHRLLIVDADDLRRLHAAFTIITGIEVGAVACAVTNRIVVLGRNDLAGLRIRVVLKVENQRGQLTHDQTDGGGEAAVKGRGHRHRTVEALALGGGKDVAVKGTQILVGQCPQQVAHLVGHVAALALDLHAEVRAVVKAQADLLSVKVDIIGLGQLDAGAAHHGAVLNSLHRHDALGIRRSPEQASGRVDGTQSGAVPAESEGDILRKRHIVSAAVHAGSSELDLGAGRVDLVAGQHCRMVKLSAGLGSGDQQQARQGGTFRAVGGYILDGSHAAALALGDEGGRTTAIAVEHIGAAQADHHGGQLVHAHTGRDRLLTAIIDHHHQCAVGLQAHHRAGRAAAGGMILSGVQAHTVLDDIAPCRNGVYLGAIQRLITRTDGCLSILVDHQVVIAVTGILVIYLAVDDQHTRRIGGCPGKVDIGGAHDVIAQGLRRRYLLAHHLIAPIGLRYGHIPGVQLHILVAGHYRNIWVAEIRLQHVANVLIRSRAVVENDLLFRDTGRDLIGLLRNHRIVCVALRCSRGLGLSLVADGKRRHWQ